MPLQIPPGYAHVAIQFRSDGDPDPWYTTYGIELTDSVEDFSDAASAEVMLFHDAWKGAFPQTTTFTGAQMTVGQDGPDNLVVFGAPNTTRKGTSTQAMLPQNCALLVDKNTAVGGRRGRGRMFLPGCLPEGDVNAYGLIESSIRTIFQSYADSWETLRESYQPTARGPLVLLHSSGISAIIDPTPITSLTVQQIISTQRRRLR